MICIMRSPSDCKYLSLVLSLLAILASGCGTGDHVTLAPVKGTVTLDGQPVPDARVIFHPTEGGRPSNAMTEPDGSFELVYMEDKLGALKGKHKVIISTLVEADPDSTDTLTQSGQREMIPASYNTQTTLEAEVDAGVNELNFDLKSSGGV